MPFDPDEWDPAEADDLGGGYPALAPDVLLDRLITDTPGAVKREPQERMVHTIHDALVAGEHVAVEAGTGTGKSYGYLVGALAPGKRVIVSTSTKQLGEQLAVKDVPAVAAAAAALGREIKVALLKGRSNYACKQKVDDTLNAANQFESVLFDEASDKGPSEIGAQVTAILDWVRKTDTGDRSEAPAVSEKVWSQFSTDSGTCPGKKQCPFGDVCFAEAAKRRASQADIAVVNHTLLAHFMEMQTRGIPTPISEFDVLVTDEAHDLEPAISKAWSYEVNSSRIERAFTAAKRLGDTAESTIKTGLTSVETLKFALAHLPEGALRTLPEEVEHNMLSLIGNLRSLARIAKTNAEAADGSVKVGWTMLSQRLGNAGNELQDTLDINRELYVQSVDRQRDGSATLKTEPLSIAQRFPEALNTWQLVLTSATLTVGGRFEPITNALGVDAPGTDVGTPFDYPKQAMLYVPPKNFPAPVGSPEDRVAHTLAVLDTLERLVDAAGGRTLGLFTTTRAAREAAERIRATFPNLNVLAHGDAPMGQLVDEFRDDETSVLLGTRGLWQGLDIKGPSLSVVLIDKIPFPMFNDPLMSARKRKVDEAGGRGFDEVMVAYAAIALAQGAGRLIRTAADRGVIAVMDPRLRTKYYGPALMRSLPHVRSWDDLTMVEAALRRLSHHNTEYGVAA